MSRADQDGLGTSLRAAFVRLIEQRFGLRLVGSLADKVDGIVLHLVASSSFSFAYELFDAFAAGAELQLLEVLGTRLTVADTGSFQVTPQIEAVRDTVLPDLVDRHAIDRRLRVWSAGCSTGEEPHLLAMLLYDELSNPEEWKIDLVGSDLNRAALEAARLGVYGEWSFGGVESDVRSRFFTRSVDRWQVVDRVRDMVRFEHLNLAEAVVPFASQVESVDLIVCRNVTPYFHELATQRLYQRFAVALRSSGWLILGAGDPVPRPALGLEQVVKDGVVLWRRPAVTEVASRRRLTRSAAVLPTPIRRARP